MVKSGEGNTMRWSSFVASDNEGIVSTFLHSCRFALMQDAIEKLLI